LRDRNQDIPEMAAHFALKSARKLGLAPCLPDAEDLGRLVAYDWPGNVRELAAVIERAAILGEGRRLEVAKALGVAAPVTAVDEKPEPAATDNLPQPKAEFPTLDQAMARHILDALAMTGGKIEGPAGAARLLAINPHTLRARVRKLGVRRTDFRS
jgi:DNA-binding NtrC family response regulator